MTVSAGDVFENLLDDVGYVDAMLFDFALLKYARFTPVIRPPSSLFFGFKVVFRACPLLIEEVVIPEYTICLFTKSCFSFNYAEL